MAESDFQERTEQPTQKRLDEARRRGQVPRSRELSMAAVLGAGAIVLLASREQLAADALQLMARSLQFDAAMIDDPRRMTEAFGSTALASLTAIAPLLGVLAVAAFLGVVSVGGFMFSAEPMAFKFERIDPIAGFGRMFSVNSLAEVLKGVAKALLIGGATVAFLLYAKSQILAIGIAPVRNGIGDSMSLVLMTFAICSGAIAVIAAFDAPFQLWNHNRQLRMTRQEIIDELKETEGRPEVRNRIRQLQQEVSRRRMLADVPKADVVVTNPTHFAVALKYEEGRMRAPRVLAKGADNMAATIRAVALDNKVALFEAPMLARALYWTTEVGQDIPAQLYLGVAQVLTYVYRLKSFNERGGIWPDKPVVQVDEKLASGPQPGRRRRR